MVKILGQYSVVPKVLPVFSDCKVTEPTCVLPVYGVPYKFVNYICEYGTNFLYMKNCQKLSSYIVQIEITVLLTTISTNCYYRTPYCIPYDYSLRLIVFLTTIPYDLLETF